MRRASLLAVLLLATPAAEATPDESAPGRLRNTTTVAATVRPFLHLFAPGGGLLSHARAAHHFDRPFSVSVQLSPLALVTESGTTGAISHARVHGAYSDELIEIGLGVGGRLQRWGPSGLSLAGTLRLGSLDGFHVAGEYVYSLVRNYYTDRAQFHIAAISGVMAIPIGRRAWIELDGGFGFDFFAYGTVSLRHRLWGSGGPGTLDVIAGGGLAWIVDRYPCMYQDPTPCEGAAGSAGPTLAFGFEHRF